MQCRTCGTEIADKAIVCFRCGAATTDPVRKAVVIPKSGGPLPFVVAAVMILTALVLAYISQGSADAERWRAAAVVVSGAAAVVLVMGILRRRKG